MIDCRIGNGKYLVAYHPAYWDNVHYNEVDVDTDSYRVLKTQNSGQKELGT